METAIGKARDESISRLAELIDSYKKCNRPHSRVMAELAAMLARRMGLAQPDINAIFEAALLHDIGLYAMSPVYHSSPGPLSFEDRVDMWRHSVIGEQQMAKRGSTRQAQLLVRWHHEWWNGTGYPDMLSFEDIPIGARVLRAVELMSALAADRP